MWRLSDAGRGVRPQPSARPGDAVQPLGQHAARRIARAGSALHPRGHRRLDRVLCGNRATERRTLCDGSAQYLVAVLEFFDPAAGSADVRGRVRAAAAPVADDAADQPWRHDARLSGGHTPLAARVRWQRMPALPLITHARADAVLAWRDGKPITAAQFLSDARALAARLPVGSRALNLCTDRYYFTVAIAACL